MEDYQGKSKSDKVDDISKPEKKLEKVVTGEVKKVKKPISARFKDIFLGGDFKTSTEYVVSDVLLPALRNLVVDTITKGVDRLIYGEHSRRPPTSRQYTDYRSRAIYRAPYSAGSGPLPSAYLPNQPRGIDRWKTNRDAESVIVGTRTEAEAVVDTITTIVDQYGVVSIADLNEILGIEGSPHTDNKWGWTHISKLEITQVREGWKIDFPPLEEV